MTGDDPILATMRRTPRACGLLVLSIAWISALTACESRQDEAPGDATPPDGESRFAVPAVPPRRILPVNASAVDFVVLLVEPERVVALPEEAFSYSSLSQDASGWNEHERIRQLTGEVVLQLEPDLIVMHEWQSPHVPELGPDVTPVLTLPVARTWPDVLESIRSVARAVRGEPRGETVIAELEARRRALAADGGRAELRGLPYGNYGTGGTTAGAGTTWNLMTELAGMRNAATDAGLTGHATIDFEQVLAIDPDFFIVGADPGTGRSPSAQLLREEPLLRDLDAIREDRIVVLPADQYSASSQRVLDAAEALARRVDELGLRSE